MLSSKRKDLINLEPVQRHSRICQNMVQARWLVTHQKHPGILSTSQEPIDCVWLLDSLSPWVMEGYKSHQIYRNFSTDCLPLMLQWYSWTLLGFIQSLYPWITCHWKFQLSDWRKDHIEKNKKQKTSALMFIFLFDIYFC